MALIRLWFFSVTGDQINCLHEAKKSIFGILMNSYKVSVNQLLMRTVMMACTAGYLLERAYDDVAALPLISSRSELSGCLG